MSFNRKHRYFASHKYGVDHVTSTHHTGNILHASTKENHDIRYHSSHDNKYLKYFRGHTGKVLSISMNPINNAFLTGSEDQTVMIWDLRANEARGVMRQMEGPTLTAWDPRGEVWAVALPDSHAVLMYSVASYDNVSGSSSSLPPIPLPCTHFRFWRES